MVSKDVIVKYEFDNVNVCIDMTIVSGILILLYLVFIFYDDIILYFYIIFMNNDYDNKL